MDPQARQFERTGYLFVEKLLSDRDVDEYIAKLQQPSGLSLREIVGGRGWNLPDGVNQRPEWWPLIFYEPLITIVRRILGPDVRYLQHSDLQINNDRVVWHRDNVHRTFGVGPDWDEGAEKYTVVRVAIYLQSYAESRSKLGVIPGSHRFESELTRLEFRVWDKVRRTLHRRYLLPPFMLSARPVWLRPDRGDGIIFDARVLHTPTPIRGPKYGVFLSYGAENEHSRNHRRYYLYQRKELGYQDFCPELKQRLQHEHLLLELNR
jgi:hypothetical protein